MTLKWLRSDLFFLSLVLFVSFSPLTTEVHAENTSWDLSFEVGEVLIEEGGSWDKTSSPLRGPFGVDFDANGTMYIIELLESGLFALSKESGLQTLRSRHKKSYSGDGGPLSKAELNGPHNCVVSADQKLLISDSWNHCVRIVDLKSGIIETLAGTGESGYTGDGASCKDAKFNYIMCISFSPDKENLFLADLKNRVIRRINLKSNVVETIAGNGKKGIPVENKLAISQPLVDPRAVAVDHEGRVYILERSGHALRVIDLDGKMRTVAGTGKRGFKDGNALEAQFASPKHICCDPLGNVYIADDANQAIRMYNPKTEKVSTVIGRGYGFEQVKLSKPHGVRWYQDSLYVVDTGHNRILKLKKN